MNDTPITDDELRAWKELEQAATPGPWRTEFDPSVKGETPTVIMQEGAEIWEKFLARCEWGKDGDTGEDGDSVRDCTAIEAQRNAKFIAAARTAMPRLIAEVERLRVACKAFFDRTP